MPGPSAQGLAADTQIAADLGQIDPVAGLVGSKVYVYSGVVDTVVAHSVVQATVGAVPCTRCASLLTCCDVVSCCVGVYRTQTTTTSS
jgi:hypothetical protein